MGGRWREVWARPGFQAVTKLAGATGLGQLLILGTMPLLTRLYDPSAFGLHALISAFVGVASVGACLCIDLAIVSGADEQAADELLAAALISAPMTGGLSGGILGILIGMDLFGFGRLPWWSVPIASLMVILNGLYLACRYRSLRDQEFGRVARASLSQNCGRALAPLAWHFILPGWSGLPLGELSGRCLGVSGLLKAYWSRFRASADPGYLQVWFRVVARERRYTVVLLSLVLIDALASLLIAPLLSARFGSHAAGEYFLVSLILTAPSALVGTAVADVVHARGARLHIEDPGSLPAFTRKIAWGLLLGGCAIYLPAALLAPRLLPVILGAKWPLAPSIVQAFTPFVIVAFVANPCSRLLTAVNKPQLKVWSDGLRLLGVPLLLRGCASYQVPFLRAMWYLSAFLAASYLLYFFLTYWAVQPRRSS